MAAAVRIRYMLRARIVFFMLGLAAVVGFGALGHGQTPATGSAIVVDFTAPPPIEEGLFSSLRRASDSIETKIRNAVRTSAVTLDRAGASGAHYIAGRLIVKFKNGASAASRATAMSVAQAGMSAQPS